MLDFRIQTEPNSFYIGTILGAIDPLGCLYFPENRIIRMISLEFMLTSLVVVLIPGTGVIYTISTGLFFGRRAAFMATVGCTLGILPQLLASVLGVAAVLHTSAQAFQLLKFLGVAYLLYLAWSTWTATGSPALESKASDRSGRKIAAQAFLLNVLNPKLTLFFLAFLPQFIPHDATSPTTNMLVLSSVFMLMTFIVFIVYGALADAASRYVVNNPTAMKTMQRSFSLTFAGLGCKLALTER